MSLDSWDSGEAYERYMGRWSRPVAASFIDGLALAPGLVWLDVGCGTGALTQTILSRAAPGSVWAVDPSDTFVTHADQHISDHRAQFKVSDAAQLAFEDALFDVVVSGLALNFMPVESALAEMRRVARPDGVIAAYVWDYGGKMAWLRIFWDTAVELNPAASAVDEALRFPICQPEALREAFQLAGLNAVEVYPVDVPTHFASFDDYWEPFLCKQFPALVYVASLSDMQRIALREALRQRLPTNTDGSIDLIARAWAVRGRILL